MVGTGSGGGRPMDLVENSTRGTLPRGNFPVQPGRGLSRSGRRDFHAWLPTLAVTAICGIGVGILAAGLPAGAAGAGTLALLVAAAALSVVALSQRIRQLHVVVPALVGVGLCG